MTWKTAFKHGLFRLQFALTCAVVLVGLFFVAAFLNFVESRPGIVIPDPLLKQFHPIDLTWPIFTVIYACVFLAFYGLRNRPIQIVVGLQAYGLMICFRLMSMYLLPLDPPREMILLEDPVVKQLVSGHHTPVRDLFFSGHTSTLFLLFLAAEHKGLKIFFSLATAFIALAVVLQHVHYSVDVLAAPFFAYGSFKLAYWLNRSFKEKMS